MSKRRVWNLPTMSFRALRLLSTDEAVEPVADDRDPVQSPLLRGVRPHGRSVAAADLA